MSMYPWYSIQNTRHKTLIRTTRCDATVQKGARFHPTIGSVTPNGFIIGHPELRPRCSEIQSLTSSSTEVRDKGYSSSTDTENTPRQRLLSFSYPDPGVEVLLCNLLCNLLCFLYSHTHAFFLASPCKIACAANFPSVVSSESFTDGWSAPFPH